MRIAYLSTDGWQQQLIPELEKLGHTVLSNDCDANTDLIFSRSVIKMRDSWKWRKKYPNIPAIEYVWDVYSWALKNPRPNEYDYESYKQLCKESKEVWVPSRAVQKMLKDHWDMDSRVMKCYFPTKPYDDIGDDGYAFQGLRINPDIHMDWGHRAAKELGIPFTATDPNFPMEEHEYRHALAHARFLVSPIYEMSTGGMFLFEGAMYGKPILASNSPCMGVVDYLGDTIAYFQWDDFDDLKDKMQKMYNGELKTDTAGAKKLVEEMTPDKHALDIHNRLHDYRV